LVLGRDEGLPVRVHDFLVVGVQPGYHQGDAPRGAAAGEVGGAKERVDGRARHPREAGRGDDPDLPVGATEVRLGEDGFGPVFLYK